MLCSGRSERARCAMMRMRRSSFGSTVLPAFTALPYVLRLTWLFAVDVLVFAVLSELESFMCRDCVVIVVIVVAVVNDALEEVSGGGEGSCLSSRDIPILGQSSVLSVHDNCIEVIVHIKKEVQKNQIRKIHKHCPKQEKPVIYDLPAKFP